MPTILATSNWVVSTLGFISFTAFKIVSFSLFAISPSRSSVKSSPKSFNTISSSPLSSAQLNVTVPLTKVLVETALTVIDPAAEVVAAVKVKVTSVVFTTSTLKTVLIFSIATVSAVACALSLTVIVKSSPVIVAKSFWVSVSSPPKTAQLNVTVPLTKVLVETALTVIDPAAEVVAAVKVKVTSVVFTTSTL
ncbi:hypothetical protein [Spiroplasma taiwanense]|uniref:Transmembrane protein n=1 Tax=Spiroplasma taiwanense CT-1 TaxID=1276220 RepID=S5LUR0_9MOLU|nr:hypothetical protein [Spiroplasma taiwanense]AGR41539.1 hypothetical protein STAIW_v1c09530 [Spiroplasma taiwanense CT-1]